jgi:hypothetical protein
MAQTTQKVIWTRAHWEEIDKNFPEIYEITKTEDLLINIGRRQVGAYIKSRIPNFRVLPNG